MIQVRIVTEKDALRFEDALNRTLIELQTLGHFVKTVKLETTPDRFYAYILYNRRVPRPASKPSSSPSK